MAEEITPSNQYPERNEAAFFAQQYLEAGKRLDLGPSIEQQSDGSFDVARLDTPEDTARFYEENNHLGIDLDAPDAEQNWYNIEEALKKRHTDYLELFGETVGEIAKIPVGLAEGIVENGFTPTGIAKTAYSTVEGAARGLRDMWGIAAQSENPDSLLFNFRSLIGAVMHGKVSKNWRERAEQWNEARKFLYHSHLMSQGDETLLEQFSSLNLSEETKNNLRNMVNPKVAHAMAFMGLELPSLIAAPFTGGASAELAITAGSAQVALNAKRAANATIISKIGNKMAKATQDFERMAGRFSETVAGNAAYGLGRAIQPLATMSESVFGGTIEAVAARSGYVAKELENAATVTAMNVGEAAMGANATRQTVGFIGSFGLRTSSELLQEFGDTMLQRASGVIPVSEINGLTVLERLASAKHLSPSARYAAKAANVLVDPFIQMSTAALKNSYKDALIFGGLGYANDQMRGAVGGAATGMVWGGYSGAFRHTWANINGGFHSAQVIDNFDRNFLPQVETQNSKFASFTRGILTEVDALKSTKISANTRFALQTAWLALSPADKANAILVHGSVKDLVNITINAGLRLDRIPDTSKGAFTVGIDSAGVERPVLFINKGSYRPADVGHEIMSHLVTHTLLTKGKGGEYFRQLIGSEKDGGALQSDKLLLHEAVKRFVTEDLLSRADEYGYKEGMSTQETDALLNSKGKERYDEMYKFAESVLDEIRKDAAASPMYWVNNEWTKMRDLSRRPDSRFPDRAEFTRTYLFEEIVSKYSEGLFLHTNLSEITADARMRPMRLVVERMRNEIFSKQVTEMELAGIRAKQFLENGQPVIQAEVYDGGKYHRHEGVEGVIRSMIREATMADTNPIQKLSPERQAIEAKRYGKEYLFKFAGKGATMLGTKEQNEIFTRNAMKGMSVLESLPDQFRPEFIVDEFGNKTVDMYEMKNEAYDALIAAGVLDRHAAETAMGMRDGMKRWEASGFAESNIFSAFYWGDSHRISKDGLYQRLFGKDVPITHRVFVPFELKMTFRTTDANGKSLRTPKGGMTATVVDFMAIHRRKIRLWQRPDVHRMFSGELHYARTFDDYLVNMMKDPSTRVPSAELFRQEFGSRAEAVRDICYETFGGRKRTDEGYINAPREGYSSNPENPDYPIHSMKLELMVGAERMGGAKPLPYHHGRSYEGLRRNYSVGGFAVYGGNTSRLQNAQGYEISIRNDKFKVFSPFGVMVGVFDSVKKAIKAANKDMKKLDEADIMPMPTAIEEARVDAQTKPIRQDTFLYSDKKGMNYSGGIRLSGGGIAKDTGEFITYKEDFVPDLLKKVRDVSSGLQHTSTNARPYLPNIVLTYADVLSDKGVEVDKFLKRVGAPMSTSDIAIMPSTSSGLGVFHNQGNLGEFAVSTLNTETGKHTIVVDVDAINAKHSGQGAANKIRSALEAKFSEIIQQYSKDSVIWGAPVSIPTRAIGDGTRQNYKAYAYSYGRLFKLPKAVLEQEIRDSVDSFKARLDEAMAPYASHFSIDSDGMASPIKGGLFEPTAQNLSDPNFLRKFFASAGKNPRFQGLDLESIAGLISFRRNESPVVVEKVNKVAFNIIASAYAYNNALKQYGEFIHFPDDNGGIGAAIVVRGENAKKFEPIVSNFDSIVSNLLGDWNTNVVKESKYFDSLLDLANSVSHTLIQRNSNEAVIEHSRTRGGISMEQDKASSVRAVQYIVNPSTVFENLDFSTQDIARIDSIKGDNNMQFTLGSGVGFTVAMTRNPDGTWGKNYLTGFRGGPSDVGFNKDGTFKNKTRPLFEGGPRVGSLDMVTLQEALGNLPSDAFMDSGGPINYLMLMAMHEIPEAANDITKAYEDYVKNQGVSDKAVQVSFIDRIDEIAAYYDKGLVMETADDIRGATMSWRNGGYHSPKQPLMSPYVNGWAKSKVLMSLSKHYGVNSIGEQVGTNAFTSSRAYRVMAANGNEGAVSVAMLKSLNEKVMKLSKKADITMVRQSVGELSVVKDDVKLKELKAKGLVKTIKFGGQDINIFEFSDASASLNLSRAAGRPHILPFLSAADPEVAFSEYAAGVRRRATLPANQRFLPPNVILGDARLGDIFHHQELYEYYPEFRDMKVRFKDFHGGRHTYIGDKGVIELGVRSFAAAELNLPAEQGGMIFNNKEGLRSEWIKRNPLASIILHEVQHAIQLKHGWIGTHVGINNLPQEIAAHYLANLLGAKTSLSLKSRLDAELARPEVAIKNGRFIDPSTLNDAAKTEAELRDRMVLAASSPVIRSFRSNAKPLIESAARNFADFVTAEHESGRVPDHFAAKVIDLHQRSKYALNVDDAIAIYMDMAELRKEAILTLPEYSFYMHDNMQFRSAFTAMGLVTNFDLVSHATPTEVSTLLATAVGNYQELAYLMEPVEKMARETEARRGMSEAELAQNERTMTDDYNRDPVLRLIRNSMDMSKLGSELDFARTISAQGIPSLIMKSVGGLGEVDTADSQVLTGLGKAVLMQTIALESHDILETLKRTILMTQGWTVDKDGKMRLVSGRHVLKGVNNEEFAKNLRAVLGDEAVLLNDGHNNWGQKGYTVDPMSLVGEGYTYSMEEIAVLAGATIESASSITVGNSAIDAVLSPMFPPTFKASDATRLFAESGMATQEAMRAAKVDKIINALGETVITKNDLVNLMAANHSNFVQAMAVSGTRAPIEYRSDLASRTLGNLGPEGKRSIVGTIPSAEQAFETANELDGLYSSNTKNFKVGNFVLGGRELKFEAERAAPAWVVQLGDESVLAWKAMCERVSKHITRDLQTNYVGSGSNMGPTYEILKKRYMAKALLIQPMVDAAIEKLMSDAYPDDVKVKMAITVMNDIEKSHIIISAVEHGAAKNWFEYEFNDLNNNTTMTDRSRSERLTGRVNAGDNPLAIGGKNRGHTAFMPPQLSTAIFSPFVAEGRDATGLATSTLYEVSTPTSRLTGQSSARIFATSNLGLDPALSDRISRDTGWHLQQMDGDTASNVVNQLNETLREWREMAENMRSALKDRIDGDVRGLAGEIQRMTVEEAKAVLSSIESKLSDERMSREQEIISRLANNNPFETPNEYKTLKDSPESVLRSSVPFGANKEREIRGLSTTIANAQGLVVGDAAIINVETIPTNRNAGVTFPSYGHVGSLVPPKVRSTYVRYKTYGDLATQAGLFAFAKTEDGVGHGAFERLSGMADTVEDISGYGETPTMFGTDNAHLAHVMGGNMVLTVGNFIYELVKSDTDASAFATAKTEALRAMYANDGVWGKSSPNSNPRMVGSAGQNALMMSNRTIGAATAAPMGTFLRTGYMDFWKNNKELTLDVPDCFKSEAYEQLVSMFSEANWSEGNAVKPEAMEAIRRFIGQLDDRTVDILVTEMTSLPNVRTIADTAAFFNIKKFVEKHSAMTDAEREAYPFFVGKTMSSTYVNYAFAHGVHHSVSLHAAAKDAKIGFPKEAVVAFTKAMKQAIKTEDFWLGLFAVQADLIISSEFLRPRVNTGNTNLFHYRSDIDSGRHPSIFKFDSASPARHSVEMGNSIDSHSHVTIPTYSTHPSSERLPYNSTSFKQDIQRMAGDVTTQEMAMEFMDGHSLFGMDTIQNLRTNENAAKIRSSSLNQSLGMSWRNATHDALYPQRVLNEDLGGEISKEGMSSANEEIKYPAIPKPVTEGSRRALILNQMANMAAALGVDKVAIQPARFSASTRVTPSIIGQTNSKQVAENFSGMGNNLQSRLLHNSFATGTLYRGLSSIQDRPRSGFAWNRLPDGRIIVNYSPNMEIHSVFDRGLTSVSRKQDLGLNLFRAIGYNANANGIIIPQSYRRQGSFVNAAFGGLGNFSGSAQKDFGRLLLSKVARTIGQLDPEVIEHHETAARSVLQKGIFGDIMTQHALGLLSPERANNHGVNYSKQMMGGSVAPEMNIEGLYEYAKKTSPILELSNPENGYITFILPKDATVEDFKREVLFRHMMAKSPFVDYGAPFMEIPAGIDRTIIGKTDGWGNGMDTASRYQRIMSSIPTERVSTEVNTFKDTGAVLSDSGRVGANLYARALRETALVNQNFVPNLERAFSMMESSERGYHVPESEHILSQSGDRLEVIKAMFPDRKDLEVFAWDNPSNLNLSIVAPSRGAAKVWRVGYDEIVGADAAGNPMRNRVVKQFQSESDANNFASSLSKNGIVAEQIKALNAEGEISIERAASKPNSDAMVHQGMEFNMGYDGKDDGRVMTQSNGWYVGNFQRRFNTQAEAQAFSALVTRPEVVTAKAPKHTSIRLSAGELENMDRQLRERISFRTDGSAIQFASNAMNALARGVDKHKRFKDKATGTEWYDMLTFNAVSKAEMRVTGLASFLWDHRAVGLTRKEVAEFLFTMYPNMGRTTLYGESANKHLKIPEVVNPQLAMQSHLSQYNSMLTNTFSVLDAKAAEAEAAGNTQLTAFKDQLKQMHLDAMHKALEPYMGLEEAKKRFPDIASLKAVLSSTTKADEVNAGVLEMYRNHYNDLVKGMTQEQLNIMSGVDISLPDPSTIFDSSNPRPHYLNLISARPQDARLMDPIAGSTQMLYSEGRSGQDWGTYTTAASGPYQVDVLYGHVPVAQQRLINYVNNLRMLADKATDPAEKARLESMIGSAERVAAVRRAASDKARQSGHWSTPERTMQYSHLRYSGAISMRETLPNAPLSELANEILTTRPQDQQAEPVLFAEELQSDPYQRSTFGPSKDVTKLLPSDFKQAEAQQLLPELASINQQLSVFDASIEQKQYGFRWNNDWPRENNARRVEGILAERFFGRMSLAERNMLLQYYLTRVNDSLQDQISYGNVTRTLSRELANKLGIAPELREFEFKTDQVRADFMSFVANTVLSQTTFEHVPETTFKLFGINQESKVPNLGDLTFKNYWGSSRGRTFKGHGGMIYGVLGSMALSDERIHSAAEAIAKHGDFSVDQIGHGVDFDSLAAEYADKLSSKASSNTTLNNTQIRYMTLLADDMRHLARTRGYGMEHIVKNFVEDRFFDKEKAPNARRVFKETGPTNQSTYLALNLQEAARKEASLSYEMFTAEERRKYKAFADDFWKMVDEGNANNIDSRRLKAALMFEKETGRIVEKDLIESIVTSDDYSFNALYGVDRDMDATSGHWSGMHYLAFPHQAKTTLGRMLEMQSYYIAQSIYQHTGDSKANILRERRTQIMESLKLEDKDFSYPDTIPLGEDNAYRELSVRFYGLRALQSQKRGVVIADARHHRHRYHSEGHMSNTISLGKGLVLPLSGVSDRTFPYFFMRAAEEKSNNDFIGRVMNEGLRAMVNPSTGLIEHDGVGASFTDHLVNTFLEYKGKSNMIRENYSPDAVRSVLQNLRVNYDVNSGGRPLEDVVKVILRGEAPFLSEEQRLELFGNVLSEGDDVYKRIAKTVANPQFLMQNVPVNKTHGYAVNYGAPHWNNRVYYAGLPADFVLKQSHDMFLRPVVELKDGKYNILDPKTGKLLIGGIENHSEMIERAAQLSKYLGSVPFVSIFLKTFGKVGAYAMDGHIWEGSGAKTHTTKMGGFGDTPSIEPAMSQFKSMRGVTHRPMPSMELDFTAGQQSPESFFGRNTIMQTAERDVNNPYKVEDIRGVNQQRDAAEFGFQSPSQNDFSFQLNYAAAYADAMGLMRNSDHTEVAAALNKMTGFNGPMLIIKPKFATEQHRMEMAKLIRSGLPLLSVGDLSNPNARAAEAIKTFKYYQNMRTIGTHPDDETR